MFCRGNLFYIYERESVHVRAHIHTEDKYKEPNSTACCFHTLGFFCVYVCVCGFVYFYFPDSLLGISRRTCPQMGTVPFGKSPVPNWWWKSKWGRKHHSKWGTTVTSCVTQETKTKSKPTTWQNYVSPGGNLREWVCFVLFQCNVSQTPPKVSGWTVCHRAVDLPIKVLKTHTKTEYLLRMVLSQCRVCLEHSTLYPCAVVFPYSLWGSRSKILTCVLIKVTLFSCSCPRLIRKWILGTGCLRQTSLRL